MEHKTTIFGQCMKMIGAHIAACGITAVFIFVAFWWLMFDGVWQYVFGIGFSIVYFGIIYSASKKQQEKDRKERTTTGVNPQKGVLFAAVLCAAMLIMYGLYRMSWAFMSMNGMLAAGTGQIYNFLFGFWNMPVIGMLEMNGGAAQWSVMIIMYAAAIIGCVLGYYAGCRNYNISEKLDESMYERENK